MIRIVWTEIAGLRLKEAYNFLLQYDKEVARTAVDKIRKNISMLRNEPGMGRPVMEFLNSDIRELIVPYGATGYVVLYKVEESKIIIMSLRHQKELDY